MILTLRILWRSIRRCDACNRVRPTRYSPDHGANFCRRHYRENNP